MKLQVFLLIFLITLQFCECVKIRKKNKSRSVHKNFTTETPISDQPPELIEIIELETVPQLPPTTTTDDIAITPVKELKKTIVNDDIKNLIQSLRNVMQIKRENKSSENHLITTTKKPTRNSHEMKKVHLDAPSVKKTILEKKQLIAKSIVEAPRYMELDCKFGNLSDYLSIEHSNRDLYTCESFNLRVLHENTKISSIFGQHEDGLTNKDVKVLRNVFTRSPYLPQGIIQHFPNLLHLYVPSTRVRFVMRKNFHGMVNLATLDLRFNEIEFLPNDTFLDLFSLEILSLGGNFLKKLPSNAFASLLNLRFFDVSDNDLTVFDDEIFSTNVELEEILLNHNQIRGLKSNFEQFKKIGFIDLRGNVCINTLFLKDHTEFPLLYEFQDEINYNCTRRSPRDVPKLLPGTQIKNVLSWEICSHLSPNTDKMCLTERRVND